MILMILTTALEKMYVLVLILKCLLYVYRLDLRRDFSIHVLMYSMSNQKYS